MYSLHLEMLDDFFTACYIFERRFYASQLNEENNTLRIFDDVVWNITSNTLSQIEVFINMNKIFVGEYASAVKLFSQHMHQLLDYYKPYNQETKTIHI
ncbi:MAG TPA: hypothetical protein VFX64_00300 [Candidatus Nitrosotalea sp.]|nr:hypothetical protein [Candidatus Nitrosotalea sp.]